ncbi:MAG: AfsR/SARP family transcriptional regulator [Bacillota bacterium]
MSKGKLEVYTLGKFVVKRGSYFFTGKKDHSQKLWKLFQTLISNPETSIPVEELMERLNLSLELIDAKNAVQNLVYRLRKYLSQNEKYNANKYIIYTNGGYSFNWDNDHYIDYIEFKDMCQRSEREYKKYNYDRALKNSRTALNLYNGNFLVESSESSWIIRNRVYLRQLYLEQIYMTCELLQQKNNYREIEEICHQALNIEPFEEEIHYQLLNSLIEQNKIHKARLHYKYLLNLFSLNKVKLSSDISQLVNKFEDKEQDYPVDLKMIKAELNNFGEEEGLCRLEKKEFNFYTWVSRRKKERVGKPVYLVSISLNFPVYNLDETEEEKIKDIKINLEKILTRTIRRSDPVCSWNKSQYLILLTEIEEKKVKEIIDRVRNKFYKSSITDDIILSLKYIEM